MASSHTIVAGWVGLTTSASAAEGSCLRCASDRDAIGSIRLYELAGAPIRRNTTPSLPVPPTVAMEVTRFDTLQRASTARFDRPPCTASVPWRSKADPRTATEPAAALARVGNGHAADHACGTLFPATAKPADDQRSARGARTTVSTSALLTDPPARSVTRSTSSFFPTANVRTERARDVGGRSDTRVSAVTDPFKASMVSCV